MDRVAFDRIALGSVGLFVRLVTLICLSVSLDCLSAPRLLHSYPPLSSTNHATGPHLIGRRQRRIHLQETAADWKHASQDDGFRRDSSVGKEKAWIKSVAVRAFPPIWMHELIVDRGDWGVCVCLSWNSFFHNPYAVSSRVVPHCVVLLP